MMRSLYSGVSGLKTHQTKMDVIGNNIANVNTVAFKSASTTFSDIMYQTTQSASGATATTGGTNAKQIGLGVTNGATKVSITSAGAAQSTGEAFDIRLTDSNSTNFFIVKNGSENLFTRAGSFYIDGVGNLAMTTTGYLLMGWQVDPETGDIVKDTVSELRVMQASNLTSAPEATTKATFSGVIDENDTDVTSEQGYIRNMFFYDNLGYAYTAKFAIKNVEGEKGSYTIELKSILNDDGEDIYQNYLKEQMDKTKHPENYYELDADGDVKLYNADGTEMQKVNGKYVDAANGVPKDTDDYHGPTSATFFGNSTTATHAYSVSSKNANVVETDNGKEIQYKVGNQTVTVNPKTSVYLDKSDPDNPYYYVKIDPAVTLAGSNTPTNKLEVKDLFGIGYETQLDNTDDVDAMADGDVSTGLTIDPNTGKLVRSYSSTNYDIQFKTADGTLDYVASAGNKTATLNLEGILGDEFADIEIDFTNILNYDNGGSSTMEVNRGASDGTTGAGKKLGTLTGVSIDNSGRIFGTYNNGNTDLLGQIAVAQFSNASGLESLGNNCYGTTLNSGEFDGIGVDVTADGGKMSTGQLEMSNVDLSAQFTDMIVTQRGFQANSRIITVSDTLLEELINLKR